jgi:hypothetical protein
VLPLPSSLDGDLLRVLAHALLSHLTTLIGEGLGVDAVEQATAHALALTSDVISLDDQPERQRMHGRALWELLDVLSGPVSSELLNRLDEALGETP